MRKSLITAAVSAGLVSLGAQAADVNLGARVLTGSFIDQNGQAHTVTVGLDQVDYGAGSAHKAYLKPEEYKKNVDPPYAGFVRCPGIDGPGVKGWAGVIPSVSCTWKAGYGNVPSGAFELNSLETPPYPVYPTYFRGLKPNGKTLRGVITYSPPAGTTEYPVSLTLDVMDYRNGTSHKGYLKAEYAGHRVDQSALPDGMRLTSCDYGMLTNGVDGIFGQKPVVTCQWKRYNGTQPAYNYGTVVLD